MSTTPATLNPPPFYLRQLAFDSPVVEHLEWASKFSEEKSLVYYSSSVQCTLAELLLLRDLSLKVIYVVTEVFFCVLDYQNATFDSTQKRLSVAYNALANDWIAFSMLVFKPVTALLSQKATEEFADLKNRVIVVQANRLIEKSPIPEETSTAVQKLTRLRNNVTQKALELNNLSNVFTTDTEHYNNLLEAKQDLWNEVQRLKQDEKGLINEKSRLQGEINKCNLELNRQALEYIRLESELESLTEEIGDRKNELNEYLDNLSNAHDAMQFTKNELNSTTKRLKSMVDEKERLTFDIETLNDNYEAITHDLKKQQKTIKESEKKVTDFRLLMEQNIAELAKAKQLTETIQTLNKEIAILQTSHEKLQREIETIADSSTLLTSENNELKEIKVNLIKDTNTLKTKMTQDNDVIFALTQKKLELQPLEAKVETLSKQESELTNSITTLELKKQKFEKNVSALHNEGRKLQAGNLQVRGQVQASLQQTREKMSKSHGQTPSLKSTPIVSPNAQQQD
jgi:chromosome segregation ATPase